MLTQNKIAHLLLFGCLFLSIFSCKQHSKEQQIEYLNGYWEIEKVKLPDGESKTYTLNVLIDYIELKDGKGFRKKVAPQLDGSFKVTEDEEYIEVKIEDQQVVLYYTTPYHSRKETVVLANAKNLVIKNEEQGVYTYKRYQLAPFEK